MYDYRVSFSACSFIKGIYVFGGFLGYQTSSCLVFDTKNETWTQIARMNQIRCDASCVVFEGRIVVSGGCNENEEELNTVEAYDHIDNSWTNMQNMIVRR